MRGYPQFSFWISITLIKIYISCVIISRVNNTFELVGTVLKNTSIRSIRDVPIIIFPEFELHLSKIYRERQSWKP